MPCIFLVHCLLIICIVYHFFCLFLRGGGEYVNRLILFERYVLIYTDSRDSSDEGEEEEEEGGEGGDAGKTQPEEDEAMEVEAEKASEQQGIQ